MRYKIPSPSSKYQHISQKICQLHAYIYVYSLRKVMGAARDPTQGKLGPNWEGPYRITSWQKKCTYHLETLDEQKLHHPWNAKHLQKYYQ